MKIKNDFVTNSSSCSFILYGFCIPEEKEKDFCKEIEKAFDFKMSDAELEDHDYYKFEEKFDIYISHGSEGGAKDNKSILIGEMIVDHLEDGGYVEYCELDNLTTSLKNKEKIDELSLKCNTKAKIIIGTRCC